MRKTDRDIAMETKALAINVELLARFPGMRDARVIYEGPGIGGRFALRLGGLSEAELRRTIELIRAARDAADADEGKP